MIGNLNIKYGRLLRKQFENRCAELVVEAFLLAKTNNSVQPSLEEEDITQILYDFMEESASRLKYKISTNTENRLSDKKKETSKGFAKRLSRIDLRFSTFTSMEEYKFYMEAKNLKSNNSSLKRRFIETGINNYVSQKYNDGFLVGYVLYGDITSNIQGINNLLIKDKRITEQIVIGTEKVLGHDQYYSQHASLKINHLFFDFN